MKILIAEDGMVARRLLEANLTDWGYEVVSTEDGEEAWAALQADDTIRFAILDWIMPNLDGVELCRRIRQQISERYLYVILLSGKQERECIVEGLQAGADDFLVKPFDPSELKQRLRAGMRIVELQDQLLTTQSRLKLEATHDALTGILNRGAIVDLLNREMERGKRADTPVGLIMLDLDYFKRINDTWGHQGGDQSLRQAVSSIRATVRAYDAVGRYGGEEFVVVLPDADLNQAVNVAERIRCQLAGEVIRNELDEFSITASFGVASTSRTNELVADELIHRADLALYCAKREGRNCVRPYTGDSTAKDRIQPTALAPQQDDLVLVVDNDPHARLVATRWLTDHGWQCAQADDAESALEYLAGNDVQLATVDMNMPGRSGMELLIDIKQQFPETEVVMLTGLADASAAIDALTHGACGYLIKPIEREQLCFEVAKGLERRQLEIEQRRHTQRLEARVCRQTLQIREAHEETILRLVTASMHRDEETGAHIRRVGLCSEVMAAALGWSASKVEQIRMAAPMHDVGKIGIPDAILQKPGKLTDEEFEIMKTHAKIGARMLAGSESPMLQMAQVIALSHHECWDGTGYPQGLAASNIPEPARIVAIVDAYDALTHNRVNCSALSEEEALETMRRGAGANFDPDLLHLFFDILPEVRRVSKENPDEWSLAKGSSTRVNLTSSYETDPELVLSK